MDRDDALLLFDDNDNDECRKSNERARKLSLEKQKGLVSGVSQVVFTEMGEFLSGLHQFDKLQEQKFPSIHVLQSPESSVIKEENSVIIPDKTVREVPIGNGLSETLRFLRERGTLKGGDIELGGRNTDKMKIRLVGVGSNEEGEKEIRIERTDEYGRILTPKESFRLFSHQFHGKRPGKKKQEKCMRQHQLELKIKKKKN